MREFGQLERAIMDVVWAGERPYLVREVRERLRYGRPVAYTTVMTVMAILHGKGVLRREKQGRAWRYWPAEAREEHDARLMTEVLRSGGGSPGDAVQIPGAGDGRGDAGPALCRRRRVGPAGASRPLAAARRYLADRAEHVIPPVLQARQIRPDRRSQLEVDVAGAHAGPRS